MPANPYAATRRGLAPVPVRCARRPDSKEFYVGANGEFNASDKVDLARTLKALASQIQTQELTLDDHREERHRASREVHEQLKAAFIDRSSGRFLDIGRDVTTQVQTYAERTAFMRNLFARGEVAQNQRVKITPTTFDVTAEIMTEPGKTHSQRVEDKEIYVPEFYVTAEIEMDRLAIERSSPGFLESKLLEAQNAIPVTEDRYMIQLLKKKSTVHGSHMVSALSTTNVAYLKSLVEDYGLPVTTILMANNVMNDLISGVSDFGNQLNPVSSYEALQTGRLATLFGATLYTDAYREPALQVLQKGDIFFMASQEQLGYYTDRGPVEVTEIDGIKQGAKKPTRGWALMEMLSMCVPSGKGVVYVKRQ